MAALRSEVELHNLEVPMAASGHEQQLTKREFQHCDGLESAMSSN